MSIATTHESAFENELASFQTRTAPLGLGTSSGAEKRKQLFCQSWPMVRDGLLSLEALVPASVRLIIGIVTRAGDAVAAAACPR